MYSVLQGKLEFSSFCEQVKITTINKMKELARHFIFFLKFVSFTKKFPKNIIPFLNN